MKGGDVVPNEYITLTTTGEEGEVQSEGGGDERGRNMQVQTEKSMLVMPGQRGPLRYCTTLCHRSTALAAPLLVAGSMCAEAEEEEKSGHLVRAAGAGGWRLRGGHCPRRAGVVCDRCLLATEGKTCVIPSESTLPAGAASPRAPSQLPKHQSAGLQFGWIFTSFSF